MFKEIKLSYLQAFLSGLSDNSSYEDKTSKDKQYNNKDKN